MNTSHHSSVNRRKGVHSVTFEPAASQHTDPAPHVTRSERFLAWEAREFASRGFYRRHLEAVLDAYPTLTVMESRVAALVSGLLPSREIARILGITEHSVENYRSSIRKKIDLPHNIGLTPHLQRLVLHAITKKK